MKDRYTHPIKDIQSTTTKLFHHPAYPLSLFEIGSSVSLLDEQDVIWISYSHDSTVFTKDANGIWIPSEPKMESLDGVIYDARCDVKAIIHAHSNSLESFSVSQMIPNTKTLDQCFNVCGTPASIPYAMTPEALKNCIYNAFLQPQVKCALTVGNGVYCVGKNVKEAFAVYETLDFCARVILRALRLGMPLSLSDEQLSYRYFSSSLPSFQQDTFAYRGISSHEKGIRHKMIKYLKKGLERGLFACTSGSLSVKLSSDSILITPTGQLKDDLQEQDILLVRLDSDGGFSIIHYYQEGNKDWVPSRAVKAHFAIYRHHPWVQSVISAHPLNVAVFCCIGSGLESGFMPEPYSSLKRILPMEYMDCLNEDSIASHFDETLKGSVGSVLVKNDGSLTVGITLEDAFEKLELLESVCSIAIDVHSLGNRDYQMFLT